MASVGEGSTPQAALPYGSAAGKAMASESIGTHGAAPQPRPRGLHLAYATAVALAAAVHVVVLLPLTVASGLLAPLWAVVGFHVVWALAALVVLRTARSMPLAAPLAPTAHALFLWASIAAGEAWLGWTP